MCFSFQLFYCSSVCLFFSSPRSLLNISYVFLICGSIIFLRDRNLFTIITLSSFLGRLPISCLLSCSSGILSFSFIWDPFLCCLILSKFLWLRFLFYRPKGCSSSCFRLLPHCWIRLSERLVQTFWREQVVPAHWQVKLDLVLLVDRDMSGGMFRGQLCGTWENIWRDNSCKLL